MKRMKIGALACALAGATVALALGLPAEAADHTEAPGAAQDPVADLADLYAFHEVDGNVTLIQTVNGLSPSGTDAVYDRDVLYTFHIDTDGDALSDIDIHARFGPDSAGNMGFKVENLPGAFGDVIGDVETTVARNGARAFAGLVDDPFFFDLDGYSDVLANGLLGTSGDLSTIRFDSTRDSFAGTNVTAIAVEFPISALNGATNIGTWATTSRISP